MANRDGILPLMQFDSQDDAENKIARVLRNARRLTPKERPISSPTSSPSLAFRRCHQAWREQGIPDLSRFSLRLDDLGGPFHRPRHPVLVDQMQRTGDKIERVEKYLFGHL